MKAKTIQWDPSGGPVVDSERAETWARCTDGGDCRMCAATLPPALPAAQAGAIRMYAVVPHHDMGDAVCAGYLPVDQFYSWNVIYENTAVCCMN